MTVPTATCCPWQPRCASAGAGNPAELHDQYSIRALYALGRLVAERARHLKVRARGALVRVD